MYSLDEFQYEDSAVADESLRRIEALIVEVEKRETDLQLAQKLQAEAEQRRLQAEQYSGDVEMQLESLKKHNAELQEQLANKQTEEIGIMETENEEKLSNDIIKSITPESACGLNKIMHGVAKGIDVDDGSMDDDQLDLIEYTDDKSMLVAGCAGSGKSVIAMHKAEKLFAEGKDVILIAYTKSLNGFMSVGKPKASFRFYYHYQWITMNKPEADYIIVDEIQDFTRKEIQEFINAAKKHFLFFGDIRLSLSIANMERTR